MTSRAGRAAAPATRGPVPASGLKSARLVIACHGVNSQRVADEAKAQCETAGVDADVAGSDELRSPAAPHGRFGEVIACLPDDPGRDPSATRDFQELNQVLGEYRRRFPSGLSRLLAGQPPHKCLVIQAFGAAITVRHPTYVAMFERVAADGVHAVEPGQPFDVFGVYRPTSLVSDPPSTRAAADTAEQDARDRAVLAEWGAKADEDASVICQILDRARAAFEANTRSPRLHRPVSSLDLNAVDIILDGFTTHVDLQNINAKGTLARAWRQIEADLTAALPHVKRPRPSTKNAIADLARLHRAARRTHLRSTG